MCKSRGNELTSLGRVDLSHLKHSELVTHLRTDEGRVVLPQQGASAAEVTANILDTIPRSPGMAGEANDAVSAYTQYMIMTHPDC